MASLPEHERKRATRVIGALFLARHLGKADEDVYEELGFGSVDTMRRQLRNWGMPEDLVSGEPGGGKASRRVVDAKAPQQKRRARGTGLEPVKLPAAGRALDLFEDLIDDLSAELLPLKARTEYLKDGRFVAGSGWRVFRSIPCEKATEEDADLVEIVDAGQGDAQEGRQSWVEVRVHDFGELDTTGWQPELLGGSAAPPEPLVSLCALYILRGGDPKDLVDLLHPDPAAAPLEKLTGTGKNKGLARRLREEARRLTAVVRGKDNIGGRDPHDISEVEHAAARYITLKKRAGVPDARILEELRGGAVDGVSGISPAEFDRLRDLRLGQGTGPLPGI